MENIAVFFGGESVEHDISVITALQVMKNLPTKYNLIPVYIKSNGCMVSGANLTDAKVYLDYAKNVKKEQEVALLAGEGCLYFIKNGKLKNRQKISAALLCTHGHGGEDGGLQGLLELCKIPYSSPAVASSAICMDKVFTKLVLKESGVFTPAYVHIDRCEYETNKNDFSVKVREDVSFPCIVKPARCGSSVGISICANEENLSTCIQEAFLYDDKVICEKYIQNAKEYFCAVVSLNGKLIASKVDQAQKGEFYSFAEKYIKEKKEKKQDIGKEIEERVKILAKKCYKSLDCEGVVRVDFLYNDKEDILYVNEVNTIPGSLAFNLFNTKFADLLNMLIYSAKEKYKKSNKIIYQFNSAAIEKFIQFGESEKYKK